MAAPLRTMANDDRQMFLMTDIVILVSGLTGAGKSTFINSLLGEEGRMLVGHQLTSCTTQIEYAIIDPIPNHPSFESHRVVVVDTPGFNDEYKDDRAVLRKIAEWLESACRDGITLGGVIYLHDISQTRFSAMAGNDLGMLRKSFAQSDAARQRIVLATTKWSKISLDEGEAREKELKGTYWKTLIDGGSGVHRFTGSSAGASAWEIISDLLSRCVGDSTGLDIQKPLDELRQLQSIPEDKRRRQFVYSRILRPLFGLFGLGGSYVKVESRHV
ncbi:P-loop containing nucleoside triphosphate hydrolase protein [Crassisporium funariophilum]|nr:P-loop containing nucleoside triphosphate hydrolase protein [Crassisporium funariophilum]